MCYDRVDLMNDLLLQILAECITSASVNHLLDLYNICQSMLWVQSWIQELSWK